jgi:16S rRNA (adenine1518-N6/adenine1519-N6)-dimethyltransferase
LVHLEFLREKEPSVPEPAVFQALVKALLAHRRKTISNNIKHLNSPVLDKGNVLAAVTHCQINPSRRAETLSVEEFAAVAHFCTSRR